MDGSTARIGKKRKSRDGRREGMSALQISREICSVDGGLVERNSLGLRERELSVGCLTCCPFTFNSDLCMHRTSDVEKSFLDRSTIAGNFIRDIC